MSSNVISDVTAVLGALTPQSTANGNPISLLTDNQGTNKGANKDNASHSLSNGNGSSFSKYNKQMLISNYLNRGKETNASTIQKEKSAPKDPLVATGKQSDLALSAELRDVLGTSLLTSVSELCETDILTSYLTDDESFAKAMKLLNQIKIKKNQPTENNTIDLTENNVPITPDAKSQSLPLFFHRNMQLLQGQLPLTIFNKAWQQTASDNHVDYKKAEKEVEKYRGYPFPGEWSQSRFD
ncbi:hypothetical protein DFH28DRAFT_1122791 [Melampsora americana]|nr:hypothetical protein DFH28DRAFT_1122791 [Melampsora americana]